MKGCQAYRLYAKVANVVILHRFEAPNKLVRFQPLAPVFALCSSRRSVKPLPLKQVGLAANGSNPSQRTKFQFELNMHIRFKRNILYAMVFK